MRPVLISMMFLGICAFGQDTTQINVQAAQQANDATLQAGQQANAETSRAAQQAALDGKGSCQVARPKFSLKPGAYSGAQTVFLMDRSRHATIYYTLDGAKPTDRSVRYTGPIAVGSTTHLQAIATAPGCVPSPVSEADYVLPSAPSSTPVVAHP